MTRKNKCKSVFVQQVEKGRSSCSSLSLLCHIQHSELSQHLQTTEGRVVLDNIEDDNEYRARFTEQEASPVAACNLFGYDFQTPCHGGRGQRRRISSNARAHVRSTPIFCEFQKKKSVHKLGCAFQPIEDQNNGTRPKNQWLSLERYLRSHPPQGLLRKKLEVLPKHNLENVPT